MGYELWLVIRERDAIENKGAVHISTFGQEGPARAYAGEQARSYPGARYHLFRFVDACEATITPAKWDTPPTTAEVSP